MSRALLVLSLLTVASPAIAQETCTQLIADATEAFRAGRLDEVLAKTDQCLARRPLPVERERVYVLRTNTFLALDQLPEAEDAAKALLGANPDFATALDDSERLRTLVARIRRELMRDATSSVSKMNESLLEAPATVIVVTADQIRRRGYQDLEAVLHDLPGFDISRTNGQTYSNIYQRGYRSDATNRTLFLVDGIEQNDLFSNIAYISRQYALSNIDRVEVVYGPASTMYGANAFLGVINVITRDPDDILGETKKIAGEAYLSGGSWNTKYFDGTIAGRMGSAAFSVTARQFRSDEFDLGQYPEWSYAYEDRYFDKYSLFQGGFRVPPNVVALTRGLDRQALSQANGVALGYSDLTDSWMVSGKLKVKEFLFGVQAWKSREGATSSSTKWAEPGAAQGNVWVPAQTAMYARYSTALSGSLRLTYFGQAKVHDLEPESAAFLLHSYSTGPLGIADLTTGLASYPEAFWQQSHVAQSSNQLRNEVNLVYQPRDLLSVVGGIDVRNGSLQRDYSKSSNCVPRALDPIFIPAGMDLPKVFDILRYPTNSAEERALLERAFPGLNERSGQFLGYDDAGRTRCVRQTAEPLTPGEHFSVRELGVFAQASFRPTRSIKLVAGLRIDNGDIDLQQGYGTVGTPRFAFVYSPGPFAIKAVYAEAFKDPASLERYSTVPGVRDIAPFGLELERARNLEVSIGRQTPALSADVSVYRARYSDVIGVAETSRYDTLNTDGYNQFSDKFAHEWYFTFCPLLECFPKALAQVPDVDAQRAIVHDLVNEPVRTLAFDNLATLDVWGIQANASWRRGPIELSGNYSFANQDAAAEFERTVRVGDIAAHRANVGITGVWRKVVTNLRFNFVGARPTINAAPPTGLDAYLASQSSLDQTIERLASLETPIREIDGYVVAHASATYEFHPVLGLQATVENLFNTSYADPGIQTADNVRFAARIPQPGRALFVRLLTRF